MVEALGPDKGIEKDFKIANNPFAFSPGQLNKLMNPKSLAAYRAIDGLPGIEKGLKTSSMPCPSGDGNHSYGRLALEEVTRQSEGPNSDTFASLACSQGVSTGPIEKRFAQTSHHDLKVLERRWSVSPWRELSIREEYLESSPRLYHPTSSPRNEAGLGPKRRIPGDFPSPALYRDNQTASVTSKRTSGLPSIGMDDYILLQPETRPITQEQLVIEVKGIYAGAVMVDKKCVDIDCQQSSTTNKLDTEQWQALMALQQTLLHENHDFFLASQHPSASPALRRLATKYAMPARMWRHGIHSFLELLRHRLPDSLEHMLSFLHLSYSVMASLMESVPTFEDTWIGCLGDLARYRMASEEVDVRDRNIWSGVARHWYSRAADNSPHSRRIKHDLQLVFCSEANKQHPCFRKVWPGNPESIPRICCTSSRRPQDDVTFLRECIGGCCHCPPASSRDHPVNEDRRTLEGLQCDEARGDPWLWSLRSALYFALVSFRKGLRLDFFRTLRWRRLTKCSSTGLYASSLAQN
jgi:hypothetical protein